MEKMAQAKTIITQMEALKLRKSKMMRITRRMSHPLTSTNKSKGIKGELDCNTQKVNRLMLML